MRALVPGSKSTHPAVQHRIESMDAVEETFSKRPFTLTVGGICQRCNNEWMSVIEQAASRIMAPMIGGERVVLSEADQKTLAKWLTMKAMVFQLTTGLTPIQPSAYRYMRDHLRPPPGVQVWLGARTADGGADSVVGLKGSTMGRSRDDPARMYAYAAPFVIGNFIGEVFGHNLPVDFELERAGPHADALQRIWPTAGPVEWPPPGVLPSVDDFAKDRWFDQGLIAALAAKGITLARIS
jgi:hypothetical protein